MTSATRDIVRPLRKAGIDVLEVRDQVGVIERITKSEADYFYAEPLSDDVGLPAQTIDAVLTLIAPVFVRGEKWRFLFGESRIAAEISDTKFLTKVFVNGERFGAGDKMLVKLRITQHQTPTGQIRNDYEVIDVLQIWPAGKQTPLPLSPENGI